MSSRDVNQKLRLCSPYLVGGAFALAALSQARVQIFNRENLLDIGEASGRFLIKSMDPAIRGPIVTSDGRPLAQNEDTCEFGLIFDKVPDSDAFFMSLAAATGIPAGEMRGLKHEGVTNAFWPQPLSREQMRKVQAVKVKWRADGISIGPSRKRSYPLGEAAAGFVGYLRNGEPVAGLERSMDDLLKGEDGRKIGFTDRGGAFLTMRVDDRSIERQDGKKITLTIDSSMQLAAANAIRQAVEGSHATQGAAIALDPKTGDILAMANWPTIDPARVGEPLSKGQKMTDFNPSYMAVLEPGSMFKVLTLALALEKGLVTPADNYYCNGAFEAIPNHAVHCDLHHGSRAHGQLHPVDVIAKSCNVTSARWAQKIGYEDFTGFLDASGLMSKTQIGLPLEASGSFKRDEYSKRLQLATMGFGQSMACTPLGLASAFSALANGGVRMEPRLIAKVGDKETPVKEAGRLFSAETCQTVLSFMEAVIGTDEGTGKTLRIPGYRLGGKTGTAEKVGPGAEGYVANFVGTVPADDPRVLILVMVDAPKGPRYYGAQIAGPVFAEMSRAAIRRYAIPRASAPSPSLEVSREGKTSELRLAGRVGR